MSGLRELCLLWGTGEPPAAVALMAYGSGLGARVVAEVRGIAPTWWRQVCADRRAVRAWIETSGPAEAVAVADLRGEEAIAYAVMQGGELREFGTDWEASPPLTPGEALERDPRTIAVVPRGGTHGL